VVEDADDVRQLETAFVVEPDRSYGVPVGGVDRDGVSAELLRQLAQRALTLGEARRVAPVPTVDRGGQLVIASLDTQELCVRGPSVVAELRGGGHAGHHLALAAVERSGGEHDLAVHREEQRPDARVRREHAAHGGDEAEVVGVVGGSCPGDLLGRGKSDVRVRTVFAAGHGRDPIQQVWCVQAERLPPGT
jgi:hypothetical protein